MKIRKLAPGEHGRTRALYEEVFPEDEAPFVDYYYEEKTADNTIYVVEEAEDIQAMLHLNPYTMRINGQEEQAHYIVAVATRAAFRKRGYMAALIRESLRDMYQSREPFTFLMPASEQIYLPHGFCTVYEQEQRYWNAEMDRCAKEADMCVREAGQSDADALAAFAECRLPLHFQVYARRTPEYYRRLMREYQSYDGALMILEREGKIVDCHPAIPEIAEEKAKIMVRIVHLECMLQLLGLSYLMSACFEVTDPLIEENNRCLFLTGTEYSGVMWMEGQEKNSEGSIPIDALTSLVFGSSTVQELAARDDVVMTERLGQELQKIVPLSRIFLNEIV